MPEGGLLQIKTWRGWLDEEHRETMGWGEPGEYVCVAVSDTGMGMDTRTREHIFEPFFTTKAPGKGTGLGMAMVYGLMKQHCGFVHVYSDLGNGTTVKLYFPAVAARADATPVEPLPATPPTGTERVFVVDDEVAIRRAASRVLTRLGYTVLEAANGEEALQLYRDSAEPIDLVLTDLVMPKMGGRQLRDELRRQGSLVPVLFSSGYGASELRQATSVQGDSCLDKPWTVIELAVKVRQELDRAHASVQQTPPQPSLPAE